MNSKHQHNKGAGFKLKIFFATLMLVLSFATLTNMVHAQSPSPVTDISNTSFKLLICDGPENIKHIKPDGTYDKNYSNPDFIPCDFNGLMMQIQHLITIAMIVGVLVAILGFTKAGIYFISGDPGKIKEARATFGYVVKGFIIMLSAWLIVFQVLEWLVKENTFGVLLGQ